jgi:hypothetical protein
MEGQIVLLRQSEESDQIDRVFLEHVRRSKVDTVVVDDERIAVRQPAAMHLGPQLGHHARQRRRRLGLLVLELGAQDRGEVADILGNQEVVLHEALDVLHAGMRGIAEADRNLALEVEGQPLFRPFGQEVDMAAHRPQEILGLEGTRIRSDIEHAARDQLLAVSRTR